MGRGPGRGRRAGHRLRRRPVREDSTAAKVGGKDKFLDGAVTDCGVGAIVWSTGISYDGDRLKTAPDLLGRFLGRRQNSRASAPCARGRNTRSNSPCSPTASPPADVYKVLRTPEGVERAFKKLDAAEAEHRLVGIGRSAPAMLASGEVAMSSAYNGRISGINKAERQELQVRLDRQHLCARQLGRPQGQPEQGRRRWISSPMRAQPTTR